MSAEHLYHLWDATHHRTRTNGLTSECYQRGMEKKSEYGCGTLVVAKALWNTGTGGKYLDTVTVSIPS